MKTILAILCLFLVACESLPNGCVVDAIGKRYALLAEHRLDPHTDAAVLLISYYGAPRGHAYCIWQERGRQWAYDEFSGSFQTRNPNPQDALQTAWFIEGRNVLTACWL